jgi:uncharacterized C2H2 Zn-finger protein
LNMKTRRKRYTKNTFPLVWFFELANLGSGPNPLPPTEIRNAQLRKFYLKAKESGLYDEGLWGNIEENCRTGKSKTAKRKLRFWEEEWEKDIEISFYQLFYLVEYTLTMLYISPPSAEFPLLDISHPIEIRTKRKDGYMEIKEISSEQKAWFNGSSRWEINAQAYMYFKKLLDSLKGRDPLRIRLCPICDKLFWARYENSTACSKLHTNAFRSQRNRKNKSQKKKEKELYKRRLTYLCYKLNEERKSHNDKIAILKTENKKYGNPLSASEIERLVDKI